MRVWIDLANSPHVPLMVPVVSALRGRGDEVLLTARDHAQTVELAKRQWPEVSVVDGRSPPGRAAKSAALIRRAAGLHAFARRARPDVAFSHGSYAQAAAARLARVPFVTMMDYEHQPANHLSFRLAKLVIVPAVFPEAALRRFGARPDKVIRYAGFKEDLYVGTRAPDEGILDELGLDAERVIAVFRPPPEGALYHRLDNTRFAEVFCDARRRADVQIVLLPRTPEQAARYRKGAVVPSEAVDGLSLLSLADVVVGGGGTMSREAAILGTPTYTVFAGQLAAVDRELIDRGLLNDLRDAKASVRLEKKPPQTPRGRSAGADAILSSIIEALDAAAAA
jgi:predicted glycosyltransferase